MALETIPDEWCRCIADIAIVSSFYGNESEAFDAYFALLEEFLSESHLPESKIEWQMGKKIFVSIVKAIREKPPLYLGHATFLGLSSYLMGDDRAYEDLGLAADEGRETFRAFREWVETDKNRLGLKRPWFKIIEFWSGGIDCGHTDGGAFTLFFSWLDRYTKQIDKPNLFVPKETAN